MPGIRVNNGAKKIEVNDNGDYITLDFGDNSFPDRFFNLIDNVEKRAEEAIPAAQKIAEEHEENSEAFMRETAALWRKVHEDIMEEVDAFFGPGTCKKVFGDIVPGVELYDDFFRQLMPYFEEFSRERAAKLEKYSPARMGNV